MQLHVVFAVDRAGLVGEDGETHHGVFDVGYLSQLPGIRIYCPASFAEMRAMLERAVLEDSGPVAVRYARGGEGAYKGLSCGALNAAGKERILHWYPMVCCSMNCSRRRICWRKKEFRQKS